MKKIGEEVNKEKKEERRKQSMERNQWQGKKRMKS